MKSADDKNILRGVSTLDLMKKNIKAILLLTVIIAVLLTAFSANVFGGHSTLDIVDPSFNPNVQTNVYGMKWVNTIRALPDGKLLVLGAFNTYNRAPVGKFIRLNADGSLDTTFNNQTVTAIDAPGGGRILVQPDGKIVLNAVGLVASGQGPRPLMRLNADGTPDPTFNFPQTNFIGIATLDTLGRIHLLGDFTTPNGNRRIIRLNDDGSIDGSFNFLLAAGAAIHNVSMQGNKLIVLTETGSTRRIFRLNEDGSEDATFTPFTGAQLALSRTQPDNKILYQLNTTLLRLNENGSPDATFQSINFSQGINDALLQFTSDGKIVATTSSNVATFRRYLQNGAVDPSFNQYTSPTFAAYTILPDDSIVVADGVAFAPSNVNNFVRLTPGGVVDPTFNTGGTGFQTIQPGIIQAIETYPNGKVLLGGKFDLINNVSRIRLARLNADSTVDTSFQISTSSSTGNYFSVLREIYQIRRQAGGKIIVSGWFDYVLNGATKQNIVRLNEDGSIDPTFNLSHPIPDYSQILLGGQNRFDVYGDGKLMIGNSKSGSVETTGPIRLTTGGARDASFSPTLNGTSTAIYYDDLVIQQDEKIIAAGSYTLSSGAFRTFVVRFNANGTVDSSFPYTEEPGRLKSRLALLAGGKILLSKYNFSGGFAKIQRLNSDGSVDNSFTTVTFSDTAAKLNALISLPNRKIFVGGKFTLTVGGQPAKNLLQLGADGSFEPTVYNINEEVLALAADNAGRVLVGGGFTVISAGGNANEVRSFVARLTDSTPFDYDGDGRSDISVFRPAENRWYILQSSNLAVIEIPFGADGDIPAPADFDGDGKTDAAVFRPSFGDWWYLSSVSGTQVNVHWGQAGDVPRPADFDGDGKTDFVVYRPSNSVWYRLSSTGETSIKEFGAGGDEPLVGDFDGDGKSDPAVFRPSTGDWWYSASASNGQFIPVHWGQAGDIPAPGDYDGDGKTDFVVFRPSNGGWYILRTGEQNYTILQFGLAEDKPVAGDYDGDGKMDVAVWRPSTGTWYLLQTTAGFGAAQFGAAGDMPTENSFVPSGGGGVSRPPACVDLMGNCEPPRRTAPRRKSVDVE